jgi:hypothetical protein
MNTLTPEPRVISSLRSYCCLAQMRYYNGEQYATTADGSSLNLSCTAAN